MQSSFNSRGRRVIATATPKMDETYDLKGLNLVAPDQVMPAGETPYLQNARRYADNTDETSVAMRTRQGSVVLSTPVGEAINVQNAATATGDIEVSPEQQVAIPFTPASNGAVTKVALPMKKIGSARGYVLVEIWDNALSLPGRLIARSSINPSLIGASYAEVAALFMDAPALLSTQSYWIVVKVQLLGTGTYYLNKTATGAVNTSADIGQTWVARTYNAKYKVYMSTAGFIKGFTKRYPEDTAPYTIFALGTGLQKVTNLGVPTVLEAGVVDAAADFVRFANIDERTYWLDGVNAARLWNGVDAPAAVTAIPSDNGVPVNMLFLENRMLVVPKGDQTRVDFSALYDFETAFPSVNFFYIGRPKSEDWITAWHNFRDGATIFTKETKYTLTGTSIQTFQPTPHAGTKGAISQEATAVGKEAIYFMADDRNIYAWNGSADTLISKKIFPELKKIADLSKVRLHLFNNQLRIYYNRNPDTDVNCMLLFDIVEGQWYKDTGRQVMGSMEWTFDNNELVEFSSKAGWLFFGENGYSDLGKPISFKYWTAYKSYGSGAAKDRIRRFRPVVRPAQSDYYLSVGKDIDFKNTPDMRPWLVSSGGAAWGTFNWGDGTKYGGARLVDNTAAMSGRGKHTQFRFEHEGIDQPVFLLGYIAMVNSGRPR